MVMGADYIPAVIVIAVVTDMDSIIIVIRPTIVISIYRPDRVEGNIMVGHFVLVVGNDLSNRLLSRVCLKNSRDLLQTPAGKDCSIFFQSLRTSINRRDFFTFDMH